MREFEAGFAREAVVIRVVPAGLFFDLLHDHADEEVQPVDLQPATEAGANAGAVEEFFLEGATEILLDLLPFRDVGNEDGDAAFFELSGIAFDELLEWLVELSGNHAAAEDNYAVGLEVGRRICFEIDEVAAGAELFGDPLGGLFGGAAFAGVGDKYLIFRHYPHPSKPVPRALSLLLFKRRTRRAVC